MSEMKLSLNSTRKLASGNTIPRFGLGVYQTKGSECSDAVIAALNAGYKHVDTAQGYHNEELVGKAIIDSGVPRSEVYMTTKYMPTHEVHSTDEVMSYLRQSLPKIDQSKGEYVSPGPGQTAKGEGHIDLMLLHTAWGGEEGRKNNWEAMAAAQKEGWVKDIGVSNFGVKHLESLPPPRPALNQIELHPWCQQRPIVEYCQKHGIAIEAYSPLARAKKEKWDDPKLQKICEKHSKEAGQVVLRWGLQKGYIIIPKSTNPARIKSNADVYGFELDESDMKAIDGLDQGKEGSVTWNPIDENED